MTIYEDFSYPEPTDDPAYSGPCEDAPCCGCCGASAMAADQSYQEDLFYDQGAGDFDDYDEGDFA